MTKLTAAQVEELAALREQGWSYQRLALRYGVTRGAIHYCCLREGALSPRSEGLRPANRRGTGQGFGKKIKHFSEAEDAQLLSLARAGTSIEAIGAVLGRARTSVRIRLLTLELKADVA